MSLLRRGIPSVQDTVIDIRATSSRSTRSTNETKRHDVPSASSHNSLLSTTTESDGCHIHTLPHEVLFTVFEELRTLDDIPEHANWQIYNLIGVCKRWHDIAVPLLWREVYLASHPDSDTPYGDRLLATLDLCPSAWANLQLVRKLRLRFHNNHDLVSSVRQCLGILQSMERMLHVLRATTKLTSLWIRFDPFIPLDCEDIELWTIVKQANEIMRQAAVTVGELGSSLEQLEISVGREEYRYEERCREEADQLLRALL